MSFDHKSLLLLGKMLNKLESGFTDLPDYQPTPDIDALRPVLMSVAERMQDNYPYQHPLYAGQMLKPPHPVARLAYALAQFINPNNHAMDGGRASSLMEREAVADLAAMFGWKEHLGHLCGGGTMANMEALWIAARVHPGKKIVASDQAHYTHTRISQVLQVPFATVATDKNGRMDVSALKKLLPNGDIGTVVATMGTTGIGTTDPLEEIIELADMHNVRVHVDAAYGGYFILANNLASETRTSFNSIHKADSVVVDPHKHGLQPYGCGCVLFKDPEVGAYYKHDSPYTYFSSDDLHLGEISLECSRAGASAVALWATQQLMPLTDGSNFAKAISLCRNAACDLHSRLDADDRFLTVVAPELDIVLWAPTDGNASVISTLSRKMFDNAAARNLHLALVELPESLLASRWPSVEFDTPSVICLRSCLMKPEHAEWMDEIWGILDAIG